MDELQSILREFAASEWELISIPAQQWLAGNPDKEALRRAIRQADDLCGNCGCKLDPLYIRALDLL